MKSIPFCLLLILTGCSGQERVEVPETRVSLVPPDGFTVSVGFNGLQNKNKHGIEIQDLYGNYHLLKGQYSEEQLERKGIKVLNSESTTIQNYTGVLHEVKIDDDANAFSLVFGDSSFCAVLFGTYPSSSENDGKKMKESLLSARYDKNKIPPSLNSKISVDDSQSPFKLATSSSNFMIYSLNGEVKSDYGLDPNLKIHEIPFDKDLTPQDIADIIIEGLENTGCTNIRIMNISSEDIQGFRAYEFDANCNFGEINATIYNAVLKSDRQAITIQGGCFGECEEMISEFKKLAHSVTVNN